MFPHIFNALKYSKCLHSPIKQRTTHQKHHLNSRAYDAYDDSSAPTSDDEEANAEENVGNRGSTVDKLVGGAVVDISSHDHRKDDTMTAFSVGQSRQITAGQVFSG